MDQILFFAISKMAKNQSLNLENGQKCNFTKKNFFLIYLISRVFLPLLFKHSGSLCNPRIFPNPKMIHPNPLLNLTIINFIFNQPLSGAWPFERQINRIMPSTLRISASLSFSFFFPRRITATGNEIKRLWLLMLLHSCQGTRSYFFGTKCVSRTFWGLG